VADDRGSRVAQLADALDVVAGVTGSTACSSAPIAARMRAVDSPMARLVAPLPSMIR
jgi:hypothetical protein